jgi:hypothetical protein
MDRLKRYYGLWRYKALLRVIRHDLLWRSLSPTRITAVTHFRI